MSLRILVILDFICNILLIAINQIVISVVYYFVYIKNSKEFEDQGEKH